MRARRNSISKGMIGVFVCLCAFVTDAGAGEDRPFELRLSPPLNISASNVSLDNLEVLFESTGVDSKTRSEVLASIKDPYGLERFYGNRRFPKTANESSEVSGLPDASAGLGALISSIIIYSIADYKKTGYFDWDKLSANLNSFLDSSEFVAAFATVAGVYALSKTAKRLHWFFRPIGSAEFIRNVGSEMSRMNQLAAGTLRVRVIDQTQNSGAVRASLRSGLSPLSMLGGGLKTLIKTAGVVFAIDFCAEEWRAATREIDGAESLKKLRSDPKVRDAMSFSALFFHMLNLEKQKEVLKATLIKRALTFDFVALTTALTIGIKVGAWLGVRTRIPGFAFLGALAGAGAATVGQGFIPVEWRRDANVWIDNHKLVFLKKKCVERMQTIRDAVEAERYPMVNYLPSQREFWQTSLLSGTSLTSDLADLRNTRDSIAGMLSKYYLEYAWLALQDEAASSAPVGLRLEINRYNKYVVNLESQIAAVYRAEAYFLKALVNRTSQSLILRTMIEELKKDHSNEEALQLAQEKLKKFYMSPKANYEQALREYADASEREFLVISTLMQSKALLKRIARDVISAPADQFEVSLPVERMH